MSVLLVEDGRYVKINTHNAGFLRRSGTAARQTNLELRWIRTCSKPEREPNRVDTCALFNLHIGSTLTDRATPLPRPSRVKRILVRAARKTDYERQTAVCVPQVSLCKALHSDPEQTLSASSLTPMPRPSSGFSWLSVSHRARPASLPHADRPPGTMRPSRCRTGTLSLSPSPFSSSISTVSRSRRLLREGVSSAWSRAEALRRRIPPHRST